MRLEGIELEKFNKKISALKNFIEEFPKEAHNLERWLRIDEYFSLEELFSENGAEEFDLFYTIYERLYATKPMYGLREERNTVVDIKQFLKETFGNLAFLVLESRIWYFKESHSELIKEIAKKIANVFKLLENPSYRLKEHTKIYLYSVCNKFIEYCFRTKNPHLTDGDAPISSPKALEAIFESCVLKLINPADTYCSEAFNSAVNNAIKLAEKPEQVLAIQKITPSFIGYTYSIFNDNVCDNPEIQKLIRDEFFNSSKKKHMQSNFYTKMMDLKDPKYFERLLDILIYKNNRCRCKNERAIDIIANMVVYNDSVVGPQYRFSIEPNSKYQEFLRAVIIPFMNKHPELYDEKLFINILTKNSRRKTMGDVKKIVYSIFMKRITQEGISFEEISSRFMSFPTIYRYLITNPSEYGEWVKDKLFKENGLKGLVSMMNMLGALSSTTNAINQWSSLILSYASTMKITGGLVPTIEALDKSEDDLGSLISDRAAILIINSIFSETIKEFSKQYSVNSKHLRSSVFYNIKNKATVMQNFTPKTEPKLVYNYIRAVNMNFATDIVVFDNIPIILWEKYQASPFKYNRKITSDILDIGGPAVELSCIGDSIYSLYMYNSAIQYNAVIDDSSYYKMSRYFTDEVGYVFSKILPIAISERTKNIISNLIEAYYSDDNFENIRNVYFENITHQGLYSINSFVSKRYLCDTEEFESEFSKSGDPQREGIPTPIAVEKFFNIHKNRVSLFTTKPEVLAKIEELQIYCAMMAMT